MNKLNEIKKEFLWLKKNGYKFKEGLPPKKEFDALIFIVSDTRKKHDSGYPFIRTFAAVYDWGLTDSKLARKDLFDLGWHDHFCQYNVFIKPTLWNIDALHKNIFRVLKWSGEESFKVKRYPHGSTLSMEGDGEWH